MPGKNQPKIVQYQNCMLLRDHQLIRDDLWVQDGKILDPEKLFFDTKVAADERVDCQGAIIAPGYIELQLNGAFGVDFSCSSENTEDGVKKVAKGLLAQGVTSFCPTLITGSAEDYHKLLPRYRKSEGSKDGAGVLGVHLEGPFISHEKKGAHPEHCIRTFDHGINDVLSMYGSLDNVAIVTLAPEIPCSDTVIKELTARGITVSLGHSMANLSQGEEAVRHGASFITHLFNAMLPFHHRDPHMVGLLASDAVPRPYFGLIADGIHTHATAMRIAFRTHPTGVVLVTDAIPAMGLGVGIHHMGQQAIEIREDGLAVVAGTDILCGSIATLEYCVQHFHEATGCSVVQALEAATLHPALAMGITPSKGTLEYGTDADFILLDGELNVLQTFIAGECVWERGVRKGGKE